MTVNRKNLSLITFALAMVILAALALLSAGTALGQSPVPSGTAIGGENRNRSPAFASPVPDEPPRPAVVATPQRETTTPVVASPQADENPATVATPLPDAPPPATSPAPAASPAAGPTVAPAPAPAPQPSPRPTAIRPAEPIGGTRPPPQPRETVIVPANPVPAATPAAGPTPAPPPVAHAPSRPDQTATIGGQLERAINRSNQDLKRTIRTETGRSTATVTQTVNAARDDVKETVRYEGAETHRKLNKILAQTATGATPPGALPTSGATTVPAAQPPLLPASGYPVPTDQLAPKLEDGKGWGKMIALIIILVVAGGLIAFLAYRQRHPAARRPARAEEEEEDAAAGAPPPPAPPAPPVAPTIHPAVLVRLLQKPSDKLVELQQGPLVAKFDPSETTLKSLSELFKGSDIDFTGANGVRLTATRRPPSTAELMAAATIMHRECEASAGGGGTSP